MGNEEGENGNNGNRRNGNKITKHHLVPRNRGGGELVKNVIRIPDRYHVAWHTLVGNLTPEEALIFITKVFVKKGKKKKWKAEELYNLQLELQRKSMKKK